MLGELAAAGISNIAGAPWQASYNYHPDGDLASRQINSDPAETFTLEGDYLTDLAGVPLGWDDNGNLSRFGPQPQPQATYGFNWDNQLRTATVDGKTISFRYDPDGSRMERTCDDGQTTTSRRYVLGESGGLPVILLELAPKANPADGYDIAKSYYYVHDELVAQYDGPPSASDRYFYIADRLGSVRQVIDVNASVRHLYTYGPFGKKLESEDDPSDPPGNAFQFTGQYYDEDLDQLYLRARQYSPDLARFIARDPILGDFQEPLTLHAYLYCLNDPINLTDPSGEVSTKEETVVVTSIGESLVGVGGTNAQSILQRAKDFVSIVSQRNWIYGNTVTKAGDSVNKWIRSMNAIGQEIHHIVCKGWGNTANFGKELINSARNLISLDPASHQQITSFLNSGKRIHTFMLENDRIFGEYSTLQKYITSLSYDQQFNWGQSLLIHLATYGNLNGFNPYLYGLMP